MQDHKEHTNYTAADIRRYVQGEMSAREMHAIEKAALDDPFLADAIEGMQQAVQEHGDAAVSGQLQELHTAFNERTAVKKKPARIIALRWWQAAAAAAIVIVGALWIINYSKSDTVTSMQVAQKEEASENAHQAAPAPAADSTMAVQPAPESAATESTVMATEKKQKPVTLNKPVRTASQPALAKLDTIGLVAGNNTADPSLENRVDINDKHKEAIKDALALRRNQVSTDESLKRQAFGVKTEPAANQAKKEEDFKNRETELITIAKNDGRAKAAVVDDKNLTGIVKGRVTDPFGGPIANAQVKFPNYNYNILTDKTGYFKLPTNDSAVDVSVNAVGYGTQNFRLQNNVSLNELQLQPANVALNEVTVVGYASVKSAAKKSKTQTNYPTVMVQDAEPVFGWIAYEQYLQNNKQLPAGLAASKGNVVVSFIVNRKGQLSDFKIVQSLIKSYDDEAIRLISQGPAWKLLKGRKARITVIVRF